MMRKKSRQKTVVGALGLLVFVSVVTAVILYFPSANVANGIWSGSFDINGEGEHDFTALYINGKVVAASRNVNVVYQRQVSAGGNKYHSTMDMYITNKGMFDNVRLTGTMPTPAAIHAHYEIGNGQNHGQLELSYQKSWFEQPGSLQQLQGEWILYRGFNMLKTTIKNGVIRGADTSGCAYDV